MKNGFSVSLGSNPAACNACMAMQCAYIIFFAFRDIHVGAAIFHATQELFWTYLLGWQRVAMGIVIVAIVLFFPQGIVGWIRERRAPEMSLERAMEDHRLMDEAYATVTRSTDAGMGAQ